MTRRATTTIAILVAAVAGAVVSTTGAASNGLDARPFHDGTYVGYVRTINGHGDALAIDVPDDHHPEALVYAGGLAHLEIVGPTPRPFRIVIRSAAIVEVMTADDVLSDI